MNMMTHYGDPCIHCGIPHDDVPSGPCQGDASKAVYIMQCFISGRWDGVDRYRVRKSDGTVVDVWLHDHEGGNIRKLREDVRLRMFAP